MTPSPDSVEAVMKEFLPLTEKILEQAQTIAALRSRVAELETVIQNEFDRIQSVKIIHAERKPFAIGDDEAPLSQQEKG